MCVNYYNLCRKSRSSGRSILKGWSFSSVRCQIYAISHANRAFALSAIFLSFLFRNYDRYSIAKAYFELFEFGFDGDLIIRAFIKFFVIAIMKGVRDLKYQVSCLVMIGDYSSNYSSFFFRNVFVEIDKKNIIQVCRQNKNRIRNKQKIPWWWTKNFFNITFFNNKFVI